MFLFEFLGIKDKGKKNWKISNSNIFDAKTILKPCGL
jgi:hypothetical protein